MDDEAYDDSQAEVTLYTDGKVILPSTIGDCSHLSINLDLNRRNQGQTTHMLS